MDDKAMRVLIADDQHRVRSALRLMLGQQPGMEVLGEAVDATGLLDWTRVACPDLVLLDWELPGLPGNGVLPALRTLCPHLGVIALSGRPEARRAALDAGVDAFVSKGDPPERLLAAVNAACHKQTRRKSDVVQYLLKKGRRGVRKRAEHACEHPLFPELLRRYVVQSLRT